MSKFFSDFDRWRRYSRQEKILIPFRSGLTGCAEKKFPKPRIIYFYFDKNGSANSGPGVSRPGVVLKLYQKEKIGNSEILIFGLKLEIWTEKVDKKWT